MSEAKWDIRYLVRALLKYNASDLHLKVGRPPLYRINGKIIPAKMPELAGEKVQQLLYPLLSEKQVRDLERNRQIDFSFSVRELGRFRCSLFFQRGFLSAVVRLIPFTVPNLDELRVPAIVKDFAKRQRGLLLITGATGSGKSTTLAGIVQHLNENYPLHIVTIEDPIEFAFKDIKSSITQREVGSDLVNLQNGLVASLRQDPDVIIIGELRDYESIQLALTAAETGHLVIATLHTSDARSTIDRILDVFPPESKNQVRIQLANALIGVVSQQLAIRADGSGRVVACEIMVKSPAIESYILKNELNLIPEAIANSNTYYKMQTMNGALIELFKANLITMDEAMRGSSNPEEIRLTLGGVSREQGYEMMDKGDHRDLSQEMVSITDLPVGGVVHDEPIKKPA